MGITEDEAITITEQATDGKAAVEQGDRLAQEANEVQVAGGGFICFDEEMMNDLHHGGQIALFLKFAGIDTDQIKKFVGIDEIEVTCEGQVEGRDRISFDKRMTELCEIPALGSIAEMTQEEFPQKGDMSLHESGMLSDIRLVLFQILDFTHDLRENIGDRLMVAAADTVEKGVAGFYI